MHEKCSKQHVVLVVLLFVNGMANAGGSCVFWCKFSSLQNMQKGVAKHAWLGTKNWYLSSFGLLHDRQLLKSMGYRVKNRRCKGNASNQDGGDLHWGKVDTQDSWYCWGSALLH